MTLPDEPIAVQPIERLLVENQWLRESLMEIQRICEHPKDTIEESYPANACFHVAKKALTREIAP